MNKKLHLHSSIFIKNPHVYYVQCSESLYIKVKSYCYRHISETWGHTDMQDGMPNNSYFDKKTPNTSPLNRVNIRYFYIFFSSEESTLQFKLANDVTMKKVKMWPSLGFTIHEYV